MSELDLHISKRLKACLPPLTDAERDQLKANIKADGRVITPILYWYDGKRNVVVYGMNEWEIIRRQGITRFRAEPMPEGCETYQDVERWIFDHLFCTKMSRETCGRWYNNLKASRLCPTREEVPA